GPRGGSADRPRSALFACQLPAGPSAAGTVSAGGEAPPPAWSALSRMRAWTRVGRGPASGGQAVEVPARLAWGGRSNATCPYYAPSAGQDDTARLAGSERKKEKICPLSRPTLAVQSMRR